MSVLSDLEKELGLPSFDISFLNCSSEHIYDGVDFSTPSTSKLLEEQTQDHLLMRMGKPDLDYKERNLENFSSKMNFLDYQYSF